MLVERGNRCLLRLNLLLNRLPKDIKAGTMKSMQKDMKEWVENWKRVGPILEQILAEELRAPDYEQGLGEFLPMLDWACMHAQPRETSGLVEQQRLFMKMWEHAGVKKS